MVSWGEAQVGHRRLKLREADMPTSPQQDPSVLLICHHCRLVHSDTGGWMTKNTYRETTGIDPITCRLKHTYCPFCYDMLASFSKAA